jgi:hypothetical protein
MARRGTANSGRPDRIDALDVLQGALQIGNGPRSTSGCD